MGLPKSFSKLKDSSDFIGLVDIRKLEEKVSRKKFNDLNPRSLRLFSMKATSIDTFEVLKGGFDKKLRANTVGSCAARFLALRKDFIIL